MVRSQPLINVLVSPPMARRPAQCISAIRQAHGRASIAISKTDECNAYQAFIARHTFCREPWEDLFRLPANLEQARLEIEARVRTRTSWTITQQINRTANSQNIPFETRSLPLDQAGVLDAEPMQGGTVIQRPPRDSNGPSGNHDSSETGGIKSREHSD